MHVTAPINSFVHDFCVAQQVHRTKHLATHTHTHSKQAGLAVRFVGPDASCTVESLAVTAVCTAMGMDTTLLSFDAPPLYIQVCWAIGAVNSVVYKYE